MPTLTGVGVSLSYVPCFLYLVSSSRDVSIFHSTQLDPSGKNMYISVISELV